MTAAKDGGQSPMQRGSPLQRQHTERDAKRGQPAHRGKVRRCGLGSSVTRLTAWHLSISPLGPDRMRHMIALPPMSRVSS
ncbi:MAG: hypothetical protein ACPIOQ_82930, partial [Promethearchaeia archaeon]